MAFKSTSVSMTTTPTLIAGSSAIQGAGTTPIIDTRFASDGDPVQVTVMSNSANIIYLQGSNAALGAAPALYQLSTVASNINASAVFTFYNPSDAIWAGTSAANGTLLIAGTRQQTA